MIPPMIGGAIVAAINAGKEDQFRARIRDLEAENAALRQQVNDAMRRSERDHMTDADRLADQQAEIERLKAELAARIEDNKWAGNEIHRVKSEAEAKLAKVVALHVKSKACSCGDCTEVVARRYDALNGRPESEEDR